MKEHQTIKEGKEDRRSARAKEVGPRGRPRHSGVSVGGCAQWVVRLQLSLQGVTEVTIDLVRVR